MTAPFFTVSQTAGFVPGGTLDSTLKDRLSRSAFKASFAHMGIALADLTNIGEDPDPAGPFSIKFAASANQESEMAVFSLAKIHCMLAAFRLRERVATAAAAIGSSARNSDEVVAKINADWNAQVTRAIAKTPNDFPNLKHIFNFGSSPPWKPTFIGSLDFAALQALDPPPFHGVPKPVVDTLDFADRMKLMVRWSCNMSAGSCVRDVSFQYMNKTLAEEGFADNARNGILWLGGDYGYTKTPPIMGAPNQRANATWVRANAKGIASYLCLVWTNRLVNKEASKEMREILLERPNAGLGTSLANATPSRLRSFSKVGLNGTRSEGVIIECNVASGLIRYAAVALGGTNDNRIFSELARIFQDSIKAIH